jgi:hypothetical protein
MALAPQPDGKVLLHGRLAGPWPCHRRDDKRGPSRRQGAGELYCATLLSCELHERPSANHSRSLAKVMHSASQKLLETQARISSRPSHFGSKWGGCVQRQ